MIRRDTYKRHQCRREKKVEREDEGYVRAGLQDGTSGSLQVKDAPPEGKRSRQRSPFFFFF